MKSTKIDLDDVNIICSPYASKSVKEQFGTTGYVPMIGWVWEAETDMAIKLVAKDALCGRKETWLPKSQAKAFWYEDTIGNDYDIVFVKSWLWAKNKHEYKINRPAIARS